MLNINFLMYALEMYEWPMIMVQMRLMWNAFCQKKIENHGILIEKVCKAEDKYCVILTGSWETKLKLCDHNN